MTPELQKYYESYFDLFNTDGWKQFVEDFKESANNFNVRFVEDEASLKFVQGQLAVMDTIINWEVGVRNAYDSIEESEE